MRIHRWLLAALLAMSIAPSVASSALSFILETIDQMLITKPGLTSAQRALEFGKKQMHLMSLRYRHRLQTSHTLLWSLGQ
jgi:hypothetical protein